MIAQHRDPVGFEAFAGAREVENGFRAGANHRAGQGGEGGQVGAHVIVVAPVHPANAAGGKNLDAGLEGQKQRGGNRGAPVPARASEDRKVAQTALPNLGSIRKPLDFLVAQSQLGLAPHHARDPRFRAARAHRRHHFPHHLQVHGTGQPVGHHRAFQRDGGRGHHVTISLVLVLNPKAFMARSKSTSSMYMAVFMSYNLKSLLSVCKVNSAYPFQFSGHSERKPLLR